MKRIPTMVLLTLLATNVALADSLEPVNVNQATVKQLITLKGIGKKRAQAIVAYRQQHGHFQKAQDLLTVPGITQKVLDKVEQQNTNRLLVN